MAAINNIRWLKLGGMDTDSAAEFIAPNDWVLAFNVRVTGTSQGEDGIASNPESNQLITQSLPAGINKGIGGGSFEDVGLVVFFRYNSAGNNQISVYNSVTKTEQVIFTDKTDSGGKVLLPLNPQNYVKAILVNEIYLLWVANGLEVGFTNMNTLMSGGYGTVLAEDLSLLKPQCLAPPTGTYGSDLGQPANYLYGNLPQFNVQYVNADFNYSAWSTWSKRIVPYQQNTPTFGADVTQNNYIIVSVNIGSIRATTINIACRFALQIFSIIKSVDRAYVVALPNTSVNVATQVYEAYDPATNLYSFAFYNNDVSFPIAPTETDLAYDYIWPTNALGLLNGNIAALSDLQVGYPRPATSVTIGAAGYNPNIGIPAGTYANPFKVISFFPGDSGSGAGDHRRRVSITLGGIPHTGDAVSYQLTDIRNAGAVIVSTPYVVPSGQDGNLVAVGSSFSETIPGSNYYDNGDGTVTINFVTPSYYGLTSVPIKLFFSGALVANSIPGVLDNTVYQLALGYRDGPGGRFLPLETDNTFITPTPSYAQVFGQAIQITWKINTAAAPKNAYDYQWLITKPPVNALIDVLASVLNYKGTWDGHTNSPSLAVNVGTVGDVYQIAAPPLPTDTPAVNLGNNGPYNTGDYLYYNGQSWAILPKAFGDLTGKNILAFSLNSLNLYTSEYAQQGINTVLTYDFSPGDRCTLHYFIPLTGAINTFTITPGSGYTNGTYTNVSLSGGTGSGAVATIIVSGGKVTSVQLTNTGTGYTNGDTLTGTVTGGTGWHLVINALSVVYFNNPCINMSVLGYDSGNYIVKVENSAALVYTGGHLEYNGVQIDARNIFMRLYSPAPQNQTVSATLNGTVWYEIGERFTITNGVHDTLSGVITDGGVYYKTRQYDDALKPYSAIPVQVLATDFNYSDFYASAYASFGRPRSYYDELEKTERKAITITSQNYILGSKKNGLTRFYPADVYGEADGQTSSSFGAIQATWQRGDILVIIQELNIFYVPVNIAYQQLNAELTGVAISEKLLNNGRYETKGIGVGLAKEAFCHNENWAAIIDPNRSEPFEVTVGGVDSISGKMSKYFKQVFALAYSQGKKIVLFYNRYYDEVMCCIEAEGGILTLFPFDINTWDPFNHYVITGGDVSATPNGAHCTASYDASTGLVTYTPAANYIGGDVATFTFNPGGGNITLNNCLAWTEGTSTVNPFNFIAQFGVPTGTVIYSNTILIGGINMPVAISIVGGRYSINGGAFTSSPGTTVNGDLIQVNQTSSGSFSTLTVATLTVSAYSAPFDVTTAASPPPTDTLTPSVTSVDTGLGIIHSIFSLGSSVGDTLYILYDVSYIQNGVTYYPVFGDTTIINTGDTDTIDIEIDFDPMAGTLTDVIFSFNPSPNPVDGTSISYTTPTTIPV